MKIIEALKKVQDLARKADDLKKKIGQHCADMDYETPLYKNQDLQVAEWLQAHSDIIKETLRLKIAIQRTNLETQVTMTIGERDITKSIAEWVLRRRGLAEQERMAWNMLTDRNLKEGLVQQTSGVTREVKIRRYYNPQIRDARIEEYRSEPHIINATLEVVNATTDLIE